MGKYVIEMESGTHIFVLGPEGIVHIGEPDVVYETVDGMQIGDAIINAKPYTEPDLEQVRKEGYKEGREAGIKDGKCEAWEAARKIIHMPEGDLLNIFTECYSAVCTALQVVLKYDASEAIEKIRQYEQEKQEKDAEIKVGKEFQMGERKCVVTHIIDGTQRRVLWDNGVSGLVDNTDLFGNLTPTGRYFPEIAAVLEKMRGEQDG